MSPTDIASLVPELGQSFYDDFGRVWCVKDIRVMEGIQTGDHYVVKMAFKSPDNREASYLMTPLEFRTLALRGGLKPLMPH